MANTNEEFEDICGIILPDILHFWHNQVKSTALPKWFEKTAAEKTVIEMQLMKFQSWHFYAGLQIKTMNKSTNWRIMKSFDNLKS